MHKEENRELIALMRVYPDVGNVFGDTGGNA